MTQPLLFCAIPPAQVVPGCMLSARPFEMKHFAPFLSRREYINPSTIMHVEHKLASIRRQYSVRDMKTYQARDIQKHGLYVHKKGKIGSDSGIFESRAHFLKQPLESCGTSVRRAFWAGGSGGRRGTTACLHTHMHVCMHACMHTYIHKYLCIYV